MLYKFKGYAPQAMQQPWDGWVADNATVIGQVELGKKVSIWFGAVVRADNSKIKLGNFSNVQENAVLHTDAGIEMDTGSAASVAQARAQNLAANGNQGSNANPVAGADVRGNHSADTYVPAGTFMRGVLLAGLDAPTGGQAQQNPHPVILEIVDFANMPNKFKADYKSCRVVANGTGDLSSERAYIRLDRVSCISDDGGAIDVALKGYVADGTGKAGIRGKLVSKQGTVLANALLAGVASGIGHAFTQGAMTTSTSALGSTQTVKDGQQLQAGVGQGVGNALNQLSKYYISLAEKIFPVIEVDAGQAVDIVITRGFSIAKK